MKAVEGGSYRLREIDELLQPHGPAVSHPRYANPYQEPLTNVCYHILLLYVSRFI